jgi:hypothetical protein
MQSLTIIADFNARYTKVDAQRNVLGIKNKKKEKLSSINEN